MVRRVIDFFWGPADPRTYALVRAGVALAGWINLVDLWSRRYSYFAATGMITKDAVLQSARGGLYFSVFDWIDSEVGVTLVFLGAGAALLALGLGFWTRASAAIVFAWHLSYSDRAFPILHSWDAILRVYSLFVLISPAGRVWSLDHLRRPDATDGDDVPIYGVRLMQWQLFVIYITTVWLKVPDEFWRSGQLCAYFSVSLYSRTPNSLFLIRHEWLAAIQTYLSLIIESSVPWLLAFRRTRFAGLLAGFVLHVAIGVTSTLGVFSISMIGPYLAFLDRQDIDRIVALKAHLRGLRSGLLAKPR
jgi:Vitamin K-dependent gamma-carboxylase